MWEGFFLSGYSGNTSEGLYLGECVCWTSYELKNHFNMIDWYSRRIYWWNESLASGWNVPKFLTKRVWWEMLRIGSKFNHSSGKRHGDLWCLHLRERHLWELCLCKSEVFRGLCLWVRISTWGFQVFEFNGGSFLPWCLWLRVFLTSRSLVGPRGIYFGRRLLSIYLHVSEIKDCDVSLGLWPYFVLWESRLSWPRSIAAVRYIYLFKDPAARWNDKSHTTRQKRRRGG